MLSFALFCSLLLAAPTTATNTVKFPVQECAAQLTDQQFKEKYCPFMNVAVEDVYDLAQQKGYTLEWPNTMPDGTVVLGFTKPGEAKPLEVNITYMAKGTEFGFITQERHLFEDSLPAEVQCFLKNRCKPGTKKDTYTTTLNSHKLLVEVANLAERKGFFYTRNKGYALSFTMQ